jgi:hypothetical protein
MDSHGFKHLSGCSFGRDEHWTISEMFSERWKTKLQENAFDHSGTPYKKSQKFTKSKMEDHAKILEIRPISGQAFCIIIALHAENVWEMNINYLTIYWKISNHFLSF